MLIFVCAIQENAKDRSHDNIKLDAVACFSFRACMFSLKAWGIKSMLCISSVCYRENLPEFLGPPKITFRTLLTYYGATCIFFALIAIGEIEVSFTITSHTQSHGSVNRKVRLISGTRG